MSDQDTTAPAEEQDQPVVEAPPETGTSAPEFFEENFDPSTLPPELQPAYKQMHGAFTKKSMSVAEQRKEAEGAIQFISALQSEDQRTAALQQLVETIGEDAVLEALGIEVEDDGEDEPLGDDEPEFRDPRVDALLEERQREADLKAQQQVEDAITTEIDQLAKAAKVELDDFELNLIWDRIFALDPDPGNKPPVKRAFEQITGYKSRLTKAPARVPSPPPAGSSGAPSEDLSDPKNRRLAALAAANRVYGTD